ncbi:uncharacterized protein [Leptinotarsa decemlineata]|uniref:uncharacterized protein n=1 Tax=Leptinotarsa decemlineata TaxID=7539 RepID=UPI003D304E3D
MSPPKCRGQMLMDLVISTSTKISDEVPTSPTKEFSKEDLYHSQHEVTISSNEIGFVHEENIVEAVTPAYTPLHNNCRLTYQNSKCSDIVSENTTVSSSPVIEFLDRIETSPSEPNEIILDPATPLAKAIDHFFTSSKQTPDEPNTVELDQIAENLWNVADFLPVIHDTSNGESGASNQVKDCTNFEDHDFIPQHNNNEQEGPLLSERERPRKGRERKYSDQNRSITKQKTNTNVEYISAKGTTVNAKKFNGDSYRCRCPLKCTETLSVEQRKSEFERFWSSGSYEARCAILQGIVIE